MFHASPNCSSSGSELMRSTCSAWLGFESPVRFVQENLHAAHMSAATACPQKAAACGLPHAEVRPRHLGPCHPSWHTPDLGTSSQLWVTAQRWKQIAILPAAGQKRPLAADARFIT